MNGWKEVGQEPEMGESEYMTVRGMKRLKIIIVIKKESEKQMVTFVKMDLFTNKHSHCRNLRHGDLHAETELMPLICSHLCAHSSARSLPKSTGHLISAVPVDVPSPSSLLNVFIFI